MKKKNFFQHIPQEWNVKALATAEEYNLEALAYGLLNQQLYIPNKISMSTTNGVYHFVSYFNIDDISLFRCFWQILPSFLKCTEYTLS